MLFAVVPSVVAGTGKDSSFQKYGLIDGVVGQASAYASDAQGQGKQQEQDNGTRNKPGMHSYKTLVALKSQKLVADGQGHTHPSTSSGRGIGGH